MSPSTRRSKSLLAAGASAASPLSKTPTRQKIKLEPIDSPILTDQKRQSSYFVKEEGSIVKKEELPDPFTPSKGPQLKSAKDENVTPSKRRKVRTIRGPPKNWRTMYDGIRDWRKDNMAPVDSMGCDILAQSDTPQLFRYQTLVALQLSSQTKDPVTAEAVRNLQGHPKGGLSIDSVLDMSDAELNGYICKVGFHNRKTIYLKQTAAILKEKFDSDIPKDIQDVLSLPGVGPKMAHLLMQCAWKENSGIGVDTHVHRISNRLGWVGATKTPEDTRMELEDWLPSEHWAEVNHLLVGFGQLLCKPIGPMCAGCPIRAECPKIGTRSSPSKG